MVGHPTGNLNPEGSNVYEARSGALEDTKLATGQFPRFLESRYHKSTGRILEYMCNARSYTLPIVFDHARSSIYCAGYGDLLVFLGIAHGDTTQDYTSAADRRPVGTTRTRNS